MTLDTPRVMGVVNVTPDSFYAGSRFTEEKEILRQVEKMLLEGADFIDVGCHSTRPGAATLTVDEEVRRLRPALAAIVRAFPGAAISVDTFRSEVAKIAVSEGASIINDISGGQLDEHMFETVASLRVPYILMHMRGTPATMATMTEYENLVNELISFFHSRLSQLIQLGATDVLIDPGFGFAKTREQNFELLNALDEFRILPYPLVVGLSRKSMIWKTLNIRPESALNGTSALNTIALLKGAAILRVHDVKEAKEVVALVSEVIRRQ